MNLPYNDIAEIQEGAMSGLTKLKELGMRFNHLTVLQKNIFNGLSALEKLDLRNNDITKIQENVFPSRQLVLGISDNPLFCDSSMCLIKQREEEESLSWLWNIGPECTNYQTDWENIELSCSKGKLSIFK